MEDNWTKEAEYVELVEGAKGVMDLNAGDAALD